MAKTTEKLFTFSVHRHHIVKSLFKIYNSDMSITQHFIQLVSGDGLIKDVYAHFYNEIFSLHSAGINTNVPTGLSEEEYGTLGKIITHAFIQYNTFPMQLSKAFFELVVTDSVRDSVLLDSFKNFVLPKEKNVIEKLLRGENIGEEDKGPLFEVFADRGVSKMPSQNNFQELACDAARKVFAEKPYFTVITLRKGLLCSQDIDHLWERYKPTNKNILEYIDFDDKILPVEEKITEYLKRYLSAASSDTLVLFLQFTTGSLCIEDGSRIRIKFIIQGGQNLTVTSKACFKILHIPKQFSSFKQFKSVFDLILFNATFWSMSD